MTFTQNLRLITLPAAARAAIPAHGGLLITLTENSAIAGACGPMRANVLYAAPGPEPRRRNRAYTIGSSALVSLIVFVLWQLRANGRLVGYGWELFASSRMQRRLADGVAATVTALGLAALSSRRSWAWRCQDFCQPDRAAAAHWPH